MRSFFVITCGKPVQTARIAKKSVGKKCAQPSTLAYKKANRAHNPVNNSSTFHSFLALFTTSFAHIFLSSYLYKITTFAQFPQHLLLEPSFLKRRYL